MQATELLKNQHREIESLFRKLRGPEPALALVELAHHLVAHLEAEEQLFYPEVSRFDGELVRELLEEHALTRFALERLLHTDRGSECFGARSAVLQGLFKHHVRCQEDHLFGDTERALDVRQAEAMARDITGHYQGLLDDVGAWEARRRDGLGLHFLTT